MSYLSEQPRIVRDEYVVQHTNVSEFASILVRPTELPKGGWQSRPFRKRSKVIQNPRRVFFRKDGQVTITGANKANTVTFAPEGFSIIALAPAGNTVLFNF